MCDAPNEHGGGESRREAIIAALQTIYDPEIPVNIHELGLIYGIDIDDAGAVEVRMTLTSPACPVAGSLPGQVESTVRQVDGVTAARVELVWDPPWTPAMMTEAARLQLGMDFVPPPTSEQGTLGINHNKPR